MSEKDYTITIDSATADFDLDNYYTISGAGDLGGLTFDTTTAPNNVNVFKCRDGAELPVYGSENAACFDLSACYKKYDEIAYYSESNQKAKVVVRDSPVTMYSGQRMLIPTGLIFDLKPYQSLRIHPRSGLALKTGIVVANCEGIVDADYTHETFVMLHNISSVPFEIEPGMRIAQAEIVNVAKNTFTEVAQKPEPKTSRDGGFGSTGTK